MEQRFYHNVGRTGAVQTPYGQMRTVGQNARLSMEPGCDCERSDCGQECIASKQLFMPGMAYVPDHDFDNILPMETGFCVGTIFGCLHLPFTGKEVR